MWLFFYVVVLTFQSKNCFCFCHKIEPWSYNCWYIDECFKLLLICTCYDLGFSVLLHVKRIFYLHIWIKSCGFCFHFLVLTCSWLADICKMPLKFLLLYNLRMMKSACGKIFLSRRARDLPGRMQKTLLLVVLT